MPRRYQRRSRPYRKSRYSRRRFVRRRGQSYVRRSLGNARAYSERHYYDQDVNGTTVQLVTTVWPNGTLTNPVTPNCLFAPTVGNDISNRTGRKVAVLGIRIQGFVFKAASLSGASTPAGFRMMVVQDNQTNGVAMTPSNLLSSGAAQNMTECFQSTSSFGRYRILATRHCMMQDANFTTSGSSKQQCPFRINIKFRKPVVVHFNSTNGGTIADIIDNSFHFIIGCDNATDTSAIYYKSRVTFKDLN